MAKETCPSCGSHYPERHPAMQFEGEVQICVDDFHLTPTNQNSQKYIEAVLHERRVRAAIKAGTATEPRQ